MRSAYNTWHDPPNAASCAGNAPTLMSVKHLKKVAPMWMNVSKAIFDDEEAHEVQLPLL